MKRIYYHLIIFPAVFFFTVGFTYGQAFDKKPDEKLLTLSQALKDSTRINPEIYLPILTEILTSGISDQFRKVKIIHDWITTEIKYDTETYLRYSDLVSETYEVLRQKKGICVGYCNLFNKMCGYANIESVSISGVAKPAYITEKFLPEKFKELNHMWNGVKIYGNWYLIDITWDAGYSSKGEFIFNYSTDYLFEDPQIFITHHYPEVEKWQLLKNPVSWTEFRKLEFEEATDKLYLTKRTIRGGISFSRMFNSNIPDIIETTGFNFSVSANKGITNDLAMEAELTFDHMNIVQDLKSYQSSPYFNVNKSTFTDPVTGAPLAVGSYSLEKIGLGLNLKYHFQNETSVLPFLKTGLSVSTPFSFSPDEKGMITKEYGGNERIYRVKNFGSFNQLLYGVLISTGADLVKKEISNNDYHPVLGIELRWTFMLNSIKLFENYDEGDGMIKTYSINLMLYL